MFISIRSFKSFRQHSQMIYDKRHIHFLHMLVCENDYLFLNICSTVTASFLLSGVKRLISRGRRRLTSKANLNLDTRSARVSKEVCSARNAHGHLHISTAWNVTCQFTQEIFDIGVKFVRKDLFRKQIMTVTWKNTRGALMRVIIVTKHLIAKGV